MKKKTNKFFQKKIFLSKTSFSITGFLLFWPEGEY